MKHSIKKLPSVSPKKTEVTIAALTGLLHKTIPDDFSWHLTFDESVFSILIYENSPEVSWQFDFRASSLRSLFTKISREDWAKHRQTSWSEKAAKLDAR